MKSYFCWLLGHKWMAWVYPPTIVECKHCQYIELAENVYKFYYEER